MQIALPEELKQWCYYDITKFRYVLKDGAPDGIKEKYRKYEETELQRYL